MCWMCYTDIHFSTQVQPITIIFSMTLRINLSGILFLNNMWRLLHVWERTCLCFNLKCNIAGLVWVCVLSLNYDRNSAGECMGAEVCTAVDLNNWRAGSSAVRKNKQCTQDWRNGGVLECVSLDTEIPCIFFLSWFRSSLNETLGLSSFLAQL